MKFLNKCNKISIKKIQKIIIIQLNYLNMIICMFKAIKLLLIIIIKGRYIKLTVSIIIITNLKFINKNVLKNYIKCNYFKQN